MFFDTFFIIFITTVYVFVSYFVSPRMTEIELDFHLCAVLAQVWAQNQCSEIFWWAYRKLKKKQNISYLQSISRDDTNNLVYFFLFVKRWKISRFII